MKIVEVLYVEGGEDGFPPENLLEFQKWVNDLVDRVPEEFRESTGVSIYSGGYIDDPFPVVEVRYPRPYTEEELDAKEAKSIVLEAQYREKKLAQLGQLKIELGVD